MIMCLDRQNLQQHMIRTYNTSDKSYKCDLCGRGFTENYILNKYNVHKNTYR